MTNTKLLNENEAAAYLRRSVRTLQRWRYEKKGPPFVKLGDGKSSPIVYRESDLARFLDNNVHLSEHEGKEG